MQTSVVPATIRFGGLPPDLSREARLAALHHLTTCEGRDTDLWVPLADQIMLNNMRRGCTLYYLSGGGDAAMWLVAIGHDHNAPSLESDRLDVAAVGCVISTIDGAWELVQAMLVDADNFADLKDWWRRWLHLPAGISLVGEMFRHGMIPSQPWDRMRDPAAG